MYMEITQTESCSLCIPVFECKACLSLATLGKHTEGMVVLAPKWVRLAPNGTNPGFFQIRFQCIWRPRAKCTEI